MSVRIAAARLRTLFRLLPLGLAGCADSCEPWPPGSGKAPIARFLTVEPGEYFVHVADPQRGERANLIAFVQDEWGRNLDDHTTTFTVESGTGFTLSAIASRPDSVTLSIAPACGPTESPCTPVDAEGVVTATHAASGLTLSIPIHVRYEPTGDHGIAATPVPSSPAAAKWPMYAIASASIGAAWERTLLRAFVRRAGLGKIDDAGVTPPVGDEEAGVVLSSGYAAWRRTDPWEANAGDMTVPSTLETGPVMVPIKAVFAGEPASPSEEVELFLIGLQAGADIVSRTPIGAAITIRGEPLRTDRMEWVKNCIYFGDAVANLPEPARPEAGAITVYMLAFSTAAAGMERAAHCGPPHDRLAVSGALADLHAIFVPLGSGGGVSVAHEIGHALGLDHVTFGSAFYHDNLMATSDDLSAPMRSRLTIGQAFRVGLGDGHFIANTGLAKSGTLKCEDISIAVRCPHIAVDASARTQTP